MNATKEDEIIEKLRHINSVRNSLNEENKRIYKMLEALERERDELKEWNENQTAIVAEVRRQRDDWKQSAEKSRRLFFETDEKLSKAEDERNDYRAALQRITRFEAPGQVTIALEALEKWKAK